MILRILAADLNVWDSVHLNMKMKKNMVGWLWLGGGEGGRAGPGGEVHQEVRGQAEVAKEKYSCHLPINLSYQYC